MNQTQSWWAPLAAAAIALIGVIVGQILNAWNDGRKATRERAQKNFEHWREKKFDAYSEIVKLIQDWIDSSGLAMMLLEHDDEKARTQAAKRSAALLHTIDQAIVSSRLISSRAFYDQSWATYEEIVGLASHVIDVYAGKTPPPADVPDAFLSLRERLWRLRARAREELGVWE